MAPGPVPRTHQVIPGAHVDIILKADQPTGRQVRGTVQQVLTRGDHHRGIKVRLTDGRIGRVQSMALGVSSTGASSSSAVANTEGANPNPGPSSDLYPSSFPPSEGGRGSRGRACRPRHHDVRLDEPPDAAPEQMDLSAYIVPSKRKGRGKKRAEASEMGDTDSPQDYRTSGDQRAAASAAADVTSAIATCPVCGEFEGDETAVAHHVAEHFGS